MVVDKKEDVGVEPSLLKGVVAILNEQLARAAAHKPLSWARENCGSTYTTDNQGIFIPYKRGGKRIVYVIAKVCSRATFFANDQTCNAYI